ncbi:MAG: hypothetical protein CMF52_08380 [Legionellales bacterium]|nr:hypothetical protein [Legionellales bacterium]
MAVDYINTLGAGAGFNTKEIVTALVNAERAPEESRLNRRIETSESEISALAQAASSLQLIQTAADDLKDTSDFNNFVVSNSQETAFTVAADANASIGSHNVTVSAVAKEQRTNLTPNGATEFSSASQLLNSGAAFNLSIDIGDSSTVTHSVSVSTATPQGMVDAINAANLDVTAQLLDKGTSGSNYIVQLIGQSGTDNQFTVTPSVSNMLTSDTPSGEAAANASVIVNGVTYSRPSNSINDIVSGVTFNLNGATSGSASVSLAQDTSAVDTKIRSLVAAYNDAKVTLNELTNRENGGALAGDSIFRQAIRSVTNTFLNMSSTPGTNITRLSDLGVSINRSGFLEISDAKLSTALSDHFNDVRKVFSAETEQQTSSGIASRGVSGDLSKLIEDLSSSTGYLTTQTSKLNTDVTSYESELEDLEKKMEALQSRYNSQFASMNSLIDSLNNTKDNLVTSFENLPFTNKD